MHKEAMAGDSIEAAKRALQRILEQLSPADTFTLSLFGNTVRHCFAAPRRADVKSILEASRHVAAIDTAMGGTELENALTAVFKLGGGGDVYGLAVGGGNCGCEREPVEHDCVLSRFAAMPPIVNPKTISCSLG